MTDLTSVFEKGIRSSENYNCYHLIVKINGINNISCDYDDEGANRAVVWSVNNSSSKTYAFLSVRYPVAIITEDCPHPVLSVFQNCDVIPVRLDSAFSCDEAVLKKYAPNITFLDDRFLDTEDFSPDDERLFYIYSNIRYVTPYHFTFDEIR